MTYHIHQNLRGKWVVRRHGATRARKAFLTLAMAIRYGKELLAGNGELVVHDRAGMVQGIIRP